MDILLLNGPLIKSIGLQTNLLQVSSFLSTWMKSSNSTLLSLPLPVILKEGQLSDVVIFVLLITQTNKSQIVSFQSVIIIMESMFEAKILPSNTQVIQKGSSLSNNGKSTNLNSNDLFFNHLYSFKDKKILWKINLQYINYQSKI